MIEEKILQDEQILNHHEENTKNNVQHTMQNNEKRKLRLILARFVWFSCYALVGVCCTVAQPKYK